MSFVVGRMSMIGVSTTITVVININNNCFQGSLFPTHTGYESLCQHHIDVQPGLADVAETVRLGIFR